jgi:predicted nucleic acid-binding protein
MAMTLLLDTNIVSYYQRNDSRAKGYDRYIVGHELAISSMTIAEMYQWAAFHRWGQQRIRELEHRLRLDYLHLPIDWDTCRLWATIRAECRIAGRPISVQDAWIAATARQYDLPIVTHNPRDFEAVKQLRIITATTGA